MFSLSNILCLFFHVPGTMPKAVNARFHFIVTAALSVKTMHGTSPFYRGAKLDGSYKDTRLGWQHSNSDLVSRAHTYNHSRELVQRWAASRAFACFHTFLNSARVWRKSAHSPGRVGERQTYKQQNNVTGTVTGLSGARRRGQFRTKRTPLVTRGWQPVLWYNNYVPGLSQA